MTFPLFFASTAQFWYSLPLAVTVALVYSATRFEDLTSILRHSVRIMVWTTIFALLMFFWLRWLTAGL